MFAHRGWLLCICLVNNANKSICFVFSLFSSSPTKHLSFSSSLLIILSIHHSFYSFLLSPILLSDCLFPYPIYPFSCNGYDKLRVFTATLLQPILFLDNITFLHQSIFLSRSYPLSIFYPSILFIFSLDDRSLSCWTLAQCTHGSTSWHTYLSCW